MIAKFAKSCTIIGMQSREWIKQAEASGWRVSSVQGRTMTLCCNRQGCSGSMVLPLDNLGLPPEPCEMPHSGQYARSTMDSYQSLIAEFIRRRRSLGLDQVDLCAAIGLGDGHISKLEGLHKIASPPTLLLWAQSLGLSLTTVPAPLPPATIRAIENRKDRPYAANQVRSKQAVWARGAG